MNYYFRSIDTTDDTWNMRNFTFGQIDDFIGHSEMELDDYILLIAGNNNPDFAPGAYVIAQCINSPSKDNENKYRVQAKCIYNSGNDPFLSKNRLDELVPYKIRNCTKIKYNLLEFSNIIENLI